MVQVIVILITVYIIHFTWFNYRKMKNLKKAMVDNPDGYIKKTEAEIYKLSTQKQQYEATIEKYEAFPPSFSVNRNLKKLRKKVKNIDDQIKYQEMSKVSYEDLLEKYKEGKIDSSMLKKVLKDK